MFFECVSKNQCAHVGRTERDLLVLPKTLRISAEINFVFFRTDSTTTTTTGDQAQILSEATPVLYYAKLTIVLVAVVLLFI